MLWDSTHIDWKKSGFPSISIIINDESQLINGTRQSPHQTYTNFVRLSFSILVSNIMILFKSQFYMGTSSSQLFYNLQAGFHVRSHAVEWCVAVLHQHPQMAPIRPCLLLARIWLPITWLEYDRTSARSQANLYNQ